MSESVEDLRRSRQGTHNGAPDSDADCSVIADLSPGFAFGALDPDERLLIERHCDACPPCAMLIEQARQTATLLSFVAHPARPPAHVKAALFTRIAQSTSLVSTPPPMALPLAPAAYSAPTSALETRPASRRPGFPRLNWEFLGGSPRLAWGSMAAPLAAVPLVLALALVGGFALTAQSKVDDLRDELATSRSQVASLRDTLTTMNGFVSTSDARVYNLPADSNGSSSEPFGKVLVSPGATQAVLLVWRMKPTTNNTGYQVFMESRQGKRYAVGRLQVDHSGTGSLVFKLEHPFSAYRAVQVVPESESAGIEMLSASFSPVVGYPSDTNLPPTQ